MTDIEEKCASRPAGRRTARSRSLEEHRIWAGDTARLYHDLVVRRAGTPRREDTEAIDRIIECTYADLRRDCERGVIIDGFTLAAVLRLRPHLAPSA